MAALDFPHSRSGLCWRIFVDAEGAGIVHMILGTDRHLISIDKHGSRVFASEHRDNNQLLFCSINRRQWLLSSMAFTDSSLTMSDQRCYYSCERVHLFEKLLTPSDVGKLNRLVIPKQHAETYFPLDVEAAEGGLAISFVDESGDRLWQFRYSHWASSQSYVLTRGWSRFVKEKKLDAGDVVQFERRGGRLYIGCRRRNGNLLASAAAVHDTYHAGDGDPTNGEVEIKNTMSERENSHRFRLFGVNLLEYWPEAEY